MAERDINNKNSKPVDLVKSIISTTSPYYLHSSDHPSLIFMTTPLSESGDTYFTWRHGFLNCNAVIISWFTNALAKELQGGTAYIDTTVELWADLEEKFTQRVAPRVYNLKGAITLLQQEKSSIFSYYNKLKAIWGELHGLKVVPVGRCRCTCGAANKMQSMREEEKVFDFLIELDEEFKTVRSQISSIDPLPILGRACAIVAHEEKQHLVATNLIPTIEVVALLTKGNESRSKNGDRGYFPSCVHCAKTNHTKSHCFKIIGYPSDWCKPRKRS
ncbi:hypothetical protein ACH5RR_025691 [Cinchona calisaya]|uniref:Retrotransposon gag domain-containing protein n=1 Tax=Cinchona calisaya TaxID=153742 RepID=A0ABD2Z1H1_9GENT